MTGASTFGVILSNLHHGKKACSIILLKVDKGLKIGFFCAILSFSLTVHLWVESDEKFPLDTKEIA